MNQFHKYEIFTALMSLQTEIFEFGNFLCAIFILKMFSSKPISEFCE